MDTSTIEYRPSHAAHTSDPVAAAAPAGRHVRAVLRVARADDDGHMARHQRGLLGTDRRRRRGVHAHAV